MSQTEEEIKSIDQYEQVEELIKNALGKKQNVEFSEIFHYDSKTYEISRKVTQTENR
jgi:hypothetical protein